MAALVLLVPAPFALFLFFESMLGTAPFFGEEPSRAHLIEGARGFAWAFLLLASGPFVVWILRRTKLWLLVTIAILIIGATAVLSTLGRIT